MDETRRLLKTRMALPQMLQYREIDRDGAKHLQRNRQFSFDLIKRLSIEHELLGHEGCVNCLQWSPDGRLLASGSDDRKIIIWEPLKHTRPHILSTIHVGNIFSVKFLGVNDSMIASSSADGKVSVQDLKGSEILHCSCNKDRVKRLATCPTVPTVFWSASEDSKVIQYDLRQPHSCASQTANLFLNLGSSFELKCIALNPTKPHYIAIGCNDPYVRIYDRRKIKTCLLSEINNSTPECTYPSSSILTDPNVVQYYSPGYLAVCSAHYNVSRQSVTYIEFNSGGSEMLVNVAGDHVYLFNIDDGKSIREIKFPSLSRSRTKYNTFQCKCKPEQCSSYSKPMYKEELSSGNELCACFYMRRGYHLYRRNWVGDWYATARDCLHVIQKWPYERRAYIYLIKCLVALEWIEDATRWYDYLFELDPDCSSDKQVQAILGRMKSSTGETKKPVLFEALGGNVDVGQTEIERRLDSIDYDLRFVGHCNNTTDIMEANFLGDDFICSGSDEGVIFIWEKKTQSIIKVLIGDESIVNCLQPHPSTCLVATSGIDESVKIWTPLGNASTGRFYQDCNSLVRLNQTRLLMDPYGQRVRGVGLTAFDTFRRGQAITIVDMPNCETS